MEDRLKGFLRSKTIITLFVVLLTYWTGPDFAAWAGNWAGVVQDLIPVIITGGLTLAGVFRVIATHGLSITDVLKPPPLEKPK